jgi:hypothetical protein
VPVPINIRMKIVLLMCKFDSLIVVKRKIQVAFGIEMPYVNCIRETFAKSV